MDASKVDLFISTNGESFSQDQLSVIKEKLMQVDESKWNTVTSLQFRKPIIALIISLCFGVYGVDRFYIGDTVKGLLKLVTVGGCGFWAIYDWFVILKATREKNFEKLMQAL